MRRPRRLGALTAVVALLVVVVIGLAVVTVSVLPAALALGVAVFALVAGLGSRVRRRPGRRPTPARSAVPADRERSSGTELGSPLRWTTRWEFGVPVDEVPQIRDRLAALLGEWGLTGEEVEPTLLVVTELVSNAAEHGRGPVLLGLELHDGSVHVEVHDGATESPRLLRHDPLRLRGRGLSLVEALSLQWGWTEDPPGKVVWADVPTAWPT